MRLWKVPVIQPKRKDKRKSRYKIVYIVHAEDAAEAELAIRESVYASDGEAIGKVTESKSSIFGAQYFDIPPDADIS